MTSELSIRSIMGMHIGNLGEKGPVPLPCATSSPTAQDPENIALFIGGKSLYEIQTSSELAAGLFGRR